MRWPALARRWRRTSLAQRLLAVRIKRRSRQFEGEFAAVNVYCLFLGHGRSGHSLIAALLDAHPNMAVADELDTFAWLDRGFNRQQLFTLIVSETVRHAARGRRKGRGREQLYSYHVPGQFQGKWQALHVVGEALPVTAHLSARPAELDELQRVVGLPLRFVQVTRNPFDSIARLHRVTGRPLAAAAEHYFSVCERTVDVRAQLAADAVQVVRLEQLIAQPETTLAQLCAFLGQAAPPAYLTACAAVVFAEPQRTRLDVTWPPELIDAIVRRQQAYDFLDNYEFET